MYIDFGNTETVGKMDIHLLPDEALKCPFQVSSLKAKSM